MPTYLRPPITVPFDSLYLDPNNPRLAPENAPGYEDADALFDSDLQERTEEELKGPYDIDGIVDSLMAQGWMPIDNIVVYTYPDEENKHIVVEGNRRTMALRAIREKHLPKEEAKLQRMEDNEKRYSDNDLKEQRELVAHLKQIVADTDTIQVVPLDADTIEGLKEKLPRVLSVRHITGAKEWGNYSTDLWLLNRYIHLFNERYPEEDLRWEQDLINRVAGEASLTKTKTKWQMKATSAYSHFQREYEDELPAGEELGPSDYYLFESVVRKPWLRDLFGLGEDDLYLSEVGERALFEWVFKHPRGKNADDNPNVFYRHENVLVLERMKRYDDDEGTSFAMRFDPDDPENAPLFRKVEAEWIAHKTQEDSRDVLDDLLRRLQKIDAPTLRSGGEHIRALLSEINSLTEDYLKMITAVEA